MHRTGAELQLEDDVASTPAPRPDYARINQLERELGLVDERPIRAPRVCLAKGCDGGDEVRTWSGMLLARVHDH